MNQVSISSKIPKTARGKKTRDKLLRAAEVEFGAKGFHDAAISGITHRAGVALGSFYTYFESKETIFAALVSDLSGRTRRWIAERIADAPDRLTAERLGIQAYIEFVRQHKGIYRIISEAEFIANEAFREHYESFAIAYPSYLQEAAESGEFREGDYEVWSWAIMGIAVFLGMRYAEWEDSRSAEEIADVVADLVANGLRPRQD